MSALFACAKCYTKHPFEELSQDYQLCKECRLACPMVKCTYCRTEFQQESKSSTASICKKCEQNVKAYGKPSICNICKLLAAFIGGRCQRCSYYERFHGPPQACKQCKQKSAFDKKERNKIEGKVLCYVCEMAYKKSKAKEKAERKLSGTFSKEERRDKTKTKSKKAWLNNSPKDENDSGGGGGGGIDDDIDNDGNQIKAESCSTSSSGVVTATSGIMSSSLRRTTSASTFKRELEDSPVGLKNTSSFSNLLSLSNSAKKMKSEDKASPMLSNPFITNSTASDHMIAITNLREEIAASKKQMNQKNMLLMEKEKKIAELNAQIINLESRNWEQVNSLQKKYQTQIDDLMRKNREMTAKVNDLSRQVAAKGRKKKAGALALADEASQGSPLVEYVNTPGSSSQDGD